LCDISLPIFSNRPQWERTQSLTFFGEFALQSLKGAFKGFA
jgi:hypothetical protein